MVMGYQTKTSQAHTAPCFAAIDLGSNTCRLLVAKPRENGYKVIDSYSKVIRLGTGVHTTEYLSDDAMDRAIEALKHCARKLERYPNAKFRGVATEACRKAKNKHEFLERVYKETGLKLEIIPEYEEARLALKGCNGLINPSFPYVLAFDIGGCSTEVMWARVKGSLPTAEVIDWISLPFGVVSVIEACGGDPMLFYNDIRDKISKDLDKIKANNNILEAIAQKQVQMIGSSGTTTTVTALFHDLPYYDRDKVDGYLLPFTAIHSIAKRLRDAPPRERANHPCIGPGRCDLVMGGLAILEGICNAWPLKYLRVADRGVRDGILSDLIMEENLTPAQTPPISQLGA